MRNGQHDDTDKLIIKTCSRDRQTKRNVMITEKKNNSEMISIKKDWRKIVTNEEVFGEKDFSNLTKSTNKIKTKSRKDNDDIIAK